MPPSLSAAYVAAAVGAVAVVHDGLAPDVGAQLASFESPGLALLLVELAAPAVAAVWPGQRGLVRVCVPQLQSSHALVGYAVNPAVVPLLQLQASDVVPSPAVYFLLLHALHLLSPWL